MSRARLNYLVDAVVAASFLITALTGVLFLLPAPWLKALSLGMPGLLGVSYHTWHWLHDWSGVVATAGVVGHVGLHWRWVVAMTRRTFGAGARPACAGRAPAPAPRVAPEPCLAPVQGATPQSNQADPRYTRRGVLVGLAAVVGTVLVGAGLLEKLSQAGASTAPQTSGSRATATGTQAQSGGAGSATGSTSQSTGGGSSGAAQTLVSVDAASCVGCGRCLDVCPASVFAWDSSGRRAAAAYPDRCVRCHRCLQVCPASAITVNG